MRQSQSPRTKVRFSDLPASTTGGTVDSARAVPGSPSRSPPRLVKDAPVARERCRCSGASFVKKQRSKTSYSHLRRLDLYRLPGCRCLAPPWKSPTKSAQKAIARPYWGELPQRPGRLAKPCGHVGCKVGADGSLEDRNGQRDMPQSSQKGEIAVRQITDDDPFTSSKNPADKPIRQIKGFRLASYSNRGVQTTEDRILTGQNPDPPLRGTAPSSPYATFSFRAGQRRTVPVRCLPSNIRRALAFPAKAGFIPPMRPLPVTHGNLKLLPDWGQTIKSSDEECGGYKYNEDQPESLSPGAAKDAVVTLALVNKLDFPVRWDHPDDPPSHPKQPSNTCLSFSEASGARDHEEVSKQTRGPPTNWASASPSQRLRRAVALRRGRIADGSLPNLPNSPTSNRKVSPKTQPSAAPNPLEENNPQPNQQLHQRSSTPVEQSQRGSIQPPTDSKADADEEINDQDVLRGLRIVCAASADAEFDAMFSSKTGLRLRRFLADLKSLEELSELELKE